MCSGERARCAHFLSRCHAHVQHRQRAPCVVVVSRSVHSTTRSTSVHCASDSPLPSSRAGDCCRVSCMRPRLDGALSPLAERLPSRMSRRSDQETALDVRTPPPLRQARPLHCYRCSGSERGVVIAYPPLGLALLRLDRPSAAGEWTTQAFPTRPNPQPPMGGNRTPASSMADDSHPCRRTSERFGSASSRFGSESGCVERASSLPWPQESCRSSSADVSATPACAM